ncbi:unnamed protein product [Allacma fusca]|uniref:Uncharacterized protein n=1 Tax=Allacma fusca TaxID=39272 RepID=A0A8J2NNX9_9HEXA|nr:unnamed protein product [Allacma fusca]
MGLEEGGGGGWRGQVAGIAGLRMSQEAGECVGECRTEEGGGGEPRVHQGQCGLVGRPKESGCCHGGLICRRRHWVPS